MNDIQPNSRGFSKNDRQKREKVVNGEVHKRKSSSLKKMEGAFVAEDASTVKDYILWDVLIPAAKNLIVDMIKKTADAVFFGDRPHGTSTYRENGVSYVRYDKPSYVRGGEGSRYSSRGRGPVSYNRRTAHDFDDIVLESRVDAENVLDALVESTMRYGVVSVSDLYDLVGLESNYTDLKWGWYELADARVVRVRDGYVVSLPKCVMIDDE